MCGLGHDTVVVVKIVDRYNVESSNYLEVKKWYVSLVFFISKYTFNSSYYREFVRLRKKVRIAFWEKNLTN